MTRPTVPALILAAGLALGGLAVGLGFARGRSAERFVTVKGVAEREVRADLAIWPLRMVAASNDLSQASATLREAERAVRAFLAEQGIDSSQVTAQDFSASDAFANQYGGNVTTRYALRQTLVVRSTDPERVLRASGRVAELVQAGFVLSSGQEYGRNQGPTFPSRAQRREGPDDRGGDGAGGEAADSSRRRRRGDRRIRARTGVFEILPRDSGAGIAQESHS